MNQRLLIAVCVATLGLGYAGTRCSQELQTVAPDATVLHQDVSHDEFDQLADSAVVSGVAKEGAQLKEPTGVKLFLMRCAVPIVGLYTSTIMKYRVFKSWFKQHCVEPTARFIGSCIHLCRSKCASKATDQK
jgi:hypothetical protein